MTTVDDSTTSVAWVNQTGNKRKRTLPIPLLQLSRSALATIVDIGKRFQSLGLTVGEHSAFGKVGKHANNSHHYYGEAIDVKDWRPDNAPEYEGGQPVHWQERTRRMRDRAKELGIFNEVLGPGDKGHDSHLHLALRGKLENFDPAQIDYVVTGRRPNGSAPAAPGAGQVSATGGNQLLDLGGLQSLMKQLLGVGDEMPTASFAPPLTPATTAPSATAAASAGDWRAAAADPNRATNPADAAYWQREDIKQWAAANPQLAKPLQASANFSPIRRGALGGTQVAPLPQQ